MLDIKSVQVDFLDINVRRLLGNLQEMQSRVQLASTTIDQLLENPDNRNMTLDQIIQLEPNGISMRSILEQLGLL